MSSPKGLRKILAKHVVLCGGGKFHEDLIEHDSTSMRVKLFLERDSSKVGTAAMEDA